MENATGVQSKSIPSLKVEEVACQLNCSKSYVYKLYKQKIIRGFRLGKCFLRFEQCEVDRVKKSWENLEYTDLNKLNEAEYKKNKVTE
jgi:excisionase family DNA binding protein